MNYGCEYFGCEYCDCEYCGSELRFLLWQERDNQQKLISV